jgi:hypothetical protein
MELSPHETELKGTWEFENGRVGAMKPKSGLIGFSRTFSSGLRLLPAGGRSFTPIRMTVAIGSTHLPIPRCREGDHKGYGY